MKSNCEKTCEVCVGKKSQNYEDEMGEGFGTLWWWGGKDWVGGVDRSGRWAQPSGKGVYSVGNGAKYVSSFKDWNFDGVALRFDTSGRTFKGSYSNWLPLKGKEWRAPNDDIESCEGSFNSEGKVHGDQCTISWRNGSKFTGSCKDGRAHGKGKQTWANGATYEGDWSAWKRSGEGTMTYSNGNVYKGGWNRDRPDGNGKFTWTKYGSRFEGTFRQGHGKGTVYYSNGNEGAYTLNL